MPTHERSKTLHNFSLPCLKWGGQRFLPCVKIPPPPPPPPSHHHHRPSSSTAVVANGVIQARPTAPNPVQHRPSSSNPDLVDSSSRPWNLRTRRAACKVPEERGGGGGGNLHDSRKLCVSLTKDEIEEDFMEIARMRPPRRPKKRPRIVQKYMDVRN
ncbi:hypothetical protein LINPERPRIM_LOCUS12726 [Linum perenne]